MRRSALAALLLAGALLAATAADVAPDAAVVDPQAALPEGQPAKFNTRNSASYGRGRYRNNVPAPYDGDVVDEADQYYQNSGYDNSGYQNNNYQAGGSYQGGSNYQGGGSYQGGNSYQNYGSGQNTYTTYPADPPSAHHGGHAGSSCKCSPPCRYPDHCLLGACAQSATPSSPIDAISLTDRIASGFNTDGTSTHLVFVEPHAPSVGIVVYSSLPDIAAPILIDISTLEGVHVDSAAVVGANCSINTTCTQCAAPSGYRTVLFDTTGPPTCYSVKLPTDVACSVLKITVTTVCRNPCLAGTGVTDCQWGVQVGSSTRNTDFCEAYQLRWDDCFINGGICRGGVGWLGRPWMVKKAE